MGTDSHDQAVPERLPLFTRSQLTQHSTAPGRHRLARAGLLNRRLVARLGAARAVSRRSLRLAFSQLLPGSAASPNPESTATGEGQEPQNTQRKTRRMSRL